MVNTLLRAPTYVLICLGLICNMPSAFGDENAPRLSNYYSLDARVYSLVESDVLGSYEGYGSGSTAPSQSLSLGVSNDKRKFLVSVAANQKNGRLKANVSIQPDASDKQTKQRDEEEFDLSDLNSKTIDLAKDADGRAYRITLVPRIVQKVEPRTFRSSDLRLNTWRFQDSVVVLNDEDYLGTLNVAGAEIAWIDVPGLAKVEFSLLPLKGAESEGVLKDGTIRIKHSETRLRITNVKNGFGSTSLPSVPYHVWVRWDKPSKSIDDYRESMKQRIRNLREKSERGDIVVSKQTFKRLEQAASTGRVLQMSGGVRRAKNGDVSVTESSTD